MEFNHFSTTLSSSNLSNRVMFSATTTTFFVKLPKNGVSLDLASCLPCLCLFGYDTQRYNIIIIKQFFKTFFLRNYCIPCSLPSATRSEILPCCFLFLLSLECFLCCFVKLVRCQWTNYYFNTPQKYDT